MFSNRQVTFLFLVCCFVVAATAQTAGSGSEDSGSEDSGSEDSRPPSMPPQARDDSELVPDIARFDGYGSVQIDSFLTSLVMILVSELGDKTFFIAAIMAMKQPRIAVLAGAFGALAIMTLLSAALGKALPAILPLWVTLWASIILFFVFGCKLFKEALSMNASDSRDEEISKVEYELGVAKKSETCDVEARGEENKNKLDDEASSKKKKAAWNNGVVWQAFFFTFLAEWGDRSQIATIALAAHKDAVWVTIGGTLGHFLCTSLAVVGGRIVANRISERTVTFCGAALFFFFSLSGAWSYTH